MPPPGIASLPEGAETPSGRPKPTRKDTIMSLVELLLKEETSKGAYIWLIGHLTSADNATRAGTTVKKNLRWEEVNQD